MKQELVRVFSKKQYFKREAEINSAKDWKEEKASYDKMKKDGIKLWFENIDMHEVDEDGHVSEYPYTVVNAWTIIVPASKCKCRYRKETI